MKSQYCELKQQEDLDLVNGLGKGGAVGSIAAWQIQGPRFNRVIKLRFPPTSQNHAGGSLMFGDVHVCVNGVNSPHFYTVDQIYSLFTLHFILSLFLFLALEEAGKNTIHQPLSRNYMIHTCSSFHFQCRLSYTGLQGTWNLYSRELEVPGRGHPANLKQRTLRLNTENLEKPDTCLWIRGACKLMHTGWRQETKTPHPKV